MLVRRCSSRNKRAAKNNLGSAFSGLLFAQGAILIAALYALITLPDPDFSPQTLISFSSSQPIEVVGPAAPAAHLGNLAESAQSKVEAALKTVVHTVRSGETLAAIWGKLGAPRAGAIQAASVLKQSVPTKSSLRIGEELELVVSLKGDVVGLKRKLDDGRTVLLKGNSIEGYEAEVIDVEVIEEQKSFSGPILSSFSNSASEMSIPYTVVDEFVDLFSNRVEFSRSIQPGDTFTVTYMKRSTKDTGQQLAPGPIQSASLMTADGLLVAIRHYGRDGAAHYYDEAGKALGNYFLRYPLKFTRISSAFTHARFHPILKTTRAHNGVDFAAPIGTPVRAVADGVISEAGYNGGSGLMVKIKHGSRYSTAYLHLSKIASGIRSGTRVSRGQVIGGVGMTGLATGPHLHFSLYDGGRYVDPLRSKLPSLADVVDSIPPQYLLAAVNAIRQKHHQVSMAFVNSAKRNS